MLAIDANDSVDEERKELVKEANDWGGKIDILVSNAGRNPAFESLADLCESAWDNVFEVNLSAAFFWLLVLHRMSLAILWLLMEGIW